MHIKTQGLVLRDINYKEADKILTVLTPEGRLTVKGRGARRRSSRIAGACRFLAFSDMVLFENRGRYSLEEAEPIRLFDALSGDLDRFALASYMMELLAFVANEGEPCGPELSLALNTLHLLEEGKHPAEQVKAVFELRLMALAGLEPMLDCCVVCGNISPEEPLFHLSAGSLHCRGCRVESGGISMPLTPGALDAMRHIISSDRPFSFRLSETGRKLLGDAAEAFVLTQLERSFRTLDFYKSLRNGMENGNE